MCEHSKNQERWIYIYIDVVLYRTKWIYYVRWSVRYTNFAATFHYMLVYTAAGDPDPNGRHAQNYLEYP
jgi:hypothetical protein